jgi:hypothetical protein
MTARALLVTVHAALIDSNGADAVAEMLTEPDPDAEMVDRRLSLIAMGGEIA